MADTIRQSTIAINLNINASQLKKFNEQLDGLESSGGKFKSLADNASKAFTTINDRAGELKNNINARYKDIKNENKALSDSFKATSEKFSSFTTKAKEDTEKTSDYFSKMSKETRSSLSELERKLSGFGEKVGTLSKDDGKVDKGFTGISDRASELSSSLSSKYKDIQSSNTTLGVSFTELRKVVDDQFTGIDNRISNSANAFGKYASSYNDLVQRVSENEKAISQTNSNIVKSVNDLSDKIKKDLQQVSNSYDSLSDKGSKKLEKSLNGLGGDLDVSAEHLRTFVNTNATLQAKWREDNQLTAKSNTTLKNSAKRMTYRTSTPVEGASSTSSDSSNETSGTPVIDENKAKKAVTVTQQLNRWGRTLIKTGRDMSITSLGLGASFLSGAKDASEIQHQMQMVSNLAISSGETRAKVSKNITAMEKENSELSLKYGVSQTELAQGDEQLVRAGYTTDQALAAHKVMVQGAIASNQSYGDVMYNVTNILDQFGKRGNTVAKTQKNANEVMNEMAYSVDHGKASFNDFGESMKYAGTTAHTAHQNLSEIMADITTLSQNGVEGSQAGTSLRKILTSFLSPNTSARSQQGPAMKALGLTPDDFKYANGKLKSLSTLFGIIKGKMKEKGYKPNQEADFMHKFFGTTAQESAMLLEQHLDKINDLTGKIQGSTRQKGEGYVEWLSNKNMNTATNQIKVFQQAWKGFGIDVATTVLPEITGIVKWLEKLLLTINGWSNKTKSFVAWGAIVVAGIAPVAIVVGSIIQSIKALVAVTKFFNHPIKNLFKDSIKSNNEQIQESNEQTVASFKDVQKQAQKTNDTVNSNKGGTNSLENQVENTANGSSKAEKAIEKDAEQLEKSGTKESSTVRDLSALERFKSRFGGVTSTGTNFGKVGEAETVLNGAERSGILSKIAGSGVVQGGSKMLAGVDIASSLFGLYGMNSHNAGEKIGGTAGSIGGTAVGGMLLGPIGAGVGSSLGQWLGTKGGELIQKSIENGYKKSHPTRPDTSTSSKLESELSQVNANNDKRHSYFTSKAQRSQLLKDNKGIYDEMKKQVDSYSKYNSKKSEEDKSVLKHYGLNHTKTLNNMLSHDKKYYSNTKSQADKAIDDLIKAESKGGKARQKAMDKANKAMAKVMSNNSDQQKIILGKLRTSTKRITDKQAGDMISSSYKAMRGQIDNADKTFKTASDKAEAKYKKVTDVADRERFVTGSISQRQYKDIIAKAEQQKNDTITKATDAKNGAIKEANKQHDEVVRIAKKQTKDHLDSINEETGKALTGWEKFTKKLGNIFTSVTTLGGMFKSTTFSSTGGVKAVKGHALGGSILRDEMALVNEQGPESAYNPKQGSFRFLGNGGPMITRLYAGEHVLTASETKRLTHGGYPKGTKLNGYAGGRGGVTSKMTNQVPTGMVHVMFDATNIKDAEKMTQKSMDNVTAQVKRGYTESTKQSTTLLDQFQKASQDNWSDVYKDTDKQTNKLSDDTTQTYSDMSKQVIKNLQSLHDQSNSITKDTVTDYGNIMDGLQKLAQKAMQDAIGQLNNGVSGINASLKEFGGNTQVLKPIRFATGSNGALDKDTLAMVNDATTGPRQEAIVRNEQVYLPQGQNAMLNLQKGDEVLNGTQTQRLLRMAGMQHFAKGTGVSDDRLKEIAQSNAKDPSKAFDDEFENRADSDLGSALEQTLTGAIKSGMKGVGNNWSNSMWGMINNLINDSSGSDGSLYKAMRKYGEGHKYLMGASGPDEFDCSGLVQYALKHAFGVSVPHFSGAIMNMTKKVSRDNITPGVTLVGNGDHIGVMTDKDHYYSAFNQNIHPNILETPFNSSYFPGTPIFGNIGGVSTQPKSDDNKSNGMNSLVKGELGSPAIKWIESHLASSADGAGGAQPSGDHMHWLKQAGFNESDFSNLNWLITKESGWNVRATNPSSGAYGIPQALPASKLASAGSDWRTNPITQLEWEKDYIKGRYGSVANAVAHERSLNWYANGGWSSGPAIFGEVPGEPEVAINPKRPTADSLIQSAIDARVKYDPSSKLKAYANRGKAKENVKSMYDKAYQAIGGTKPKRRQAPVINIKQEFTFNGNVTKSDAHAISNEVDRKTRRAIREEINSYMRDLDSQVFGQ